MNALPPSRLPDALQRELDRTVGARWFSTRAADRLAAAERVRRRSRSLLPGPDAVAWPGSVEEIAQVVRLASEHGVALWPWRPPRAKEPSLHLDLSRFHRIVDLSERSQMVQVEAGMPWQRLEEELQRRGFTTGLLADEHTTLGDWLLAGQDAPPGLEDAPELLLGLTLITWDGTLYRSPICIDGSRASDWMRFLTASPRTLGVPVRVQLKIRPVPQSRQFVAFGYESVDRGLNALRHAAQSGHGGEFALMDEMESMLLQNAHEEGFLERLLQRLLKNLPGILPNLFKRGREYFNRGRAALFGKGEVLGLKLLLQQPGIFGALVRQLRGTSTLVGMFEGQAESITATERAVSSACRELGGRGLGSAPGKGWWQHRPALPLRQERFLKEGCFVQSFQMAATWDRCADVYEAVRKNLENKALVLTRFVRPTPQGCGIEFTFIAVGDENGGSFRKWIAEALEHGFREGGILGRRSGLGAAGLETLQNQLGPLFELHEPAPEPEPAAPVEEEPSEEPAAAAEG